MTAFITTAAAAVVTAFLGVVSYVVQKRTDRRVELSKRQREAYEAYLESYYDYVLTESSGPEYETAINKYNKAYFKLFPLASDSFLKEAFDFHNFAWMQSQSRNFYEQKEREDFDKKWTALILQMRKDAEIHSDLEDKVIMKHIPWSWSDYEKKPAE
jgi:hypothetical protein